MALHGAALTAWKRKHPEMVAQWNRSKPKRKSKPKHKPAPRRASPKKKHHKSHAKGSTTMAKKKKSKGKKSHRRHGGGSFFSLSGRETQIALGTTAVYGYLQAKTKEKSIGWFDKLPAVQSVGKAATLAAIAGGAAYMGVQRKYTKPLALGLGFAAVLMLAQRKFAAYTDAKQAQLAGDGDGSAYLEGDVDMSQVRAQ